LREKDIILKSTGSEQLPYLHAVIRESLRLCPGVPDRKSMVIMYWARYEFLSIFVPSSILDKWQIRLW